MNQNSINDGKSDDILAEFGIDASMDFITKNDDSLDQSLQDMFDQAFDSLSSIEYSGGNGSGKVSPDSSSLYQTELVTDDTTKHGDEPKTSESPFVVDLDSDIELSTVLSGGQKTNEPDDIVKQENIDEQPKKTKKRRRKKQDDESAGWLDQIKSWEKRKDEKDKQIQNMQGVKKEERFYDDLRSTNPDNAQKGEILYTSVENPTRIDLPILTDKRKNRSSSFRGDRENNFEQTLLPGFETTQKDESNLYRELRLNRENVINRFEYNGPSDDEVDASGTILGASEDEYKTFTDAPNIKRDLFGRRHKIKVSLIITVIAEILLAAIWGLTSPLLDVFPRSEFYLLYVASNIILTTLVLVVNYETVFYGLKSLFKLKPDMDSAMSVGVAASLVQTVVCAFMLDSFVQKGIPLFNVVTVFGLICGLIGKFYMIRRIEENFAFIANDKVKKAVVVASGQKAFDICRGVSTNESRVAYCKNITNVRNFIYHSFAEDPCDLSGRSIAGFLFPIGIVGGAISFLFSKFSNDWLWAITAFCAIICACVPITSLLGGNVPIMRICRKLLSHKVCLTGYDAVDEVSNINTIALDDTQLFPKNTVTINSIKTSDAQPFDRTVLDLVAVTEMTGGPLAVVFKNFVKGDFSSLPEVETLSYEEGMGISGWVAGYRVLVGTRELMKNHSIWIPDIDFKNNYGQKGVTDVFLSVGGTFAAALRVKYSANPQIARQLKSIVKKGYGVTVFTCDPNITEEMVCSVFSLPKNSVKIMGSNARRAYKKALTEKRSFDGSCDGTLSNTGKADSFILGLLAAFKIKRLTFFSSVVQTVFNFLGFLAGCALILTVGANFISPFILLLYYAVILLLAVCIPMLFSK